ncbi:MAG TPA: tRNA (adenosine(37)-N6)-threonylcarbamoyltransferase complex ATPase subunit type 1 TsaE [Thermoanaerobaculia bacterium]|nr:tRNA (adenosine(37)-N6)-threonylcarbamoyltransferase complex ATPase subunit type 1 TsaE [Thermoanaerobaculia bacterium]
MKGERVREIVTRGGAETESFGRELANELAAGDVIYLTGDLGAGKTTLARGIAEGLGAAPREVASPTFAILHEYAAPGGAIVMRHLDLYRLADRAGELEVLGLPDAATGAPIAVEWPGQAIRAILPPTVEITIARGSGGVRRIEVCELPRAR